MSQHVLVVDDDALECDLLQRTLHGADIRAVTMTDSRQALDLLERQSFDAIFVDVKMPPPDGMEMTRRIRASGVNRKTPVIMITGGDDRSVVTQGFEAGISFFLYKPILRDRLLNLVRVTNSVNRAEKRRFHRIQVLRKVEVRFNEEVVEGHTIDLSLNGLLAQVPRVFPIGAHLKLRLDLLPDKPPVVVNGTVVRVSGRDSMGIHLETIGLSESRQLQDFLLPLMLASPPPVA